MHRFDHKNILITGGAQGIGLACAHRFVAEGARVMLADIHEEAGRAAVQALGDMAHFRRTDVSNKMDVEGLIAMMAREIGPIDVLINNAGITHAAEFLDLDEVDFDRVMRVNLKSMFLCGQAVAREMVKRGQGGAIVNMSSVNSTLTIPNQVPYVVSKGAVNQLTRVMALSLAPHGIRVNAVAPGTILTELAKKAVLGSDDARRKILSRTPIGRCGEPEEIASVVCFAASQDASYMTGEVLYVDGGRMALNYTVPVQD